MKDVENSPQYPIENQNYTFGQQITQEQCYKINPVIVKILANYHANVNQKDAVFFTPLHYAIETLHVDLIKELINNHATVFRFNSNKTMSTPTPYESFVNSYKLHDRIVYDVNILGMMNKLYMPLYKDIKTNLESRTEYKNSIIKYLDIIYPQTLIMYNNLFYNYMISYINSWGYDDSEKLKRIMYKNIIDDYASNNKEIKKFADKLKSPILPLLNISEYSIMKDTTNMGVLKYSEEEKELLIATKEKDLIKLNHEIDNLIQESDDNPERKSILEGRIKELLDKKQKLILERNALSSEKTNISTHLNTESNKIKTELQQRINNFTLDASIRSPAKIYQKIFDNVINSGEYNGHEDFYLYNEMWQQNIIYNSKHISNIHFMTILTESILLQRKINNKQDLENLKDEFTVLDKLFKNVFCPMINDYKYLSQDTDDNYMMAEVMKIFIHNTAYILCSNLYLAIIKTATTYLISLNPKKLSKLSDNNYNEAVTKIMNNVVKKDGEKPKLELFIIKTMPEKLVKFVLKIYSDELDEDRKIDNLDIFFTKINALIMENNTIPINQDSSLIKNLNAYIYPYYKDIFTLVIESMKVLIENYNRYIINQSRYIDIMVTVLNKAINEF